MRCSTGSGGSTGLPEAALPSAEHLRAIVFDVDGTLYDQTKLRRAMLVTLVKAHLLRPRAGWRTAAVLKAYRRAQEDLRHHPGDNAAARQLEIACARTGSTLEFARECVAKWMESAPLAFLARCAPPGLSAFLHSCRQRGIRLAVLSDYPAADKLRALGVADAFELSLCAQSPEIGRFKPDPRGLLVTLQRLGVDPADALYVGDRAEVDAPAAAGAGVACAIVSRGRLPVDEGYTPVRGYDELHLRLFGSTSADAPRS
jgi:FMN phosphatase YigB (HAD superfamily)